MSSQSGEQVASIGNVRASCRHTGLRSAVGDIPPAYQAHAGPGCKRSWTESDTALKCLWIGGKMRGVLPQPTFVARRLFHLHAVILQVDSTFRNYVQAVRILRRSFMAQKFQSQTCPRSYALRPGQQKCGGMAEPCPHFQHRLASLNSRGVICSGRRECEIRKPVGWSGCTPGHRALRRQGDQEKGAIHVFQPAIQMFHTLQFNGSHPHQSQRQIPKSAPPHAARITLHPSDLPRPPPSRIAQDNAVRNITLSPC